MAYDEELAERVRAQLSALPAPGFTEQRMFGGLAFLIGGNMAVAVSGTRFGGLLVRVPHEDTDPLLDEPGAAPMVMNGRPVRGWLRVEAAQIETEEGLAAWVRRGAGHAGSLPAKPTRRR